MLQTWILKRLELHNTQNSKSLHQEVSGSVEDNSRDQFKPKCLLSYHEVQHIPRRCSVPTDVLHGPKPPSVRSSQRVAVATGS